MSEFPMRRRLASIGVMFLAVAASGADYQVTVLQRTDVGPVVRGVLYRFTTCRNGVTLVTTSAGTMVAVAPDGAVLARREDVEEIRGAAACACDEGNSFYVVARGWVRIFSLSPGGGLTLQRSLYIAGGPSSLLVTPGGELYVVGLAKAGGSHVFLRRFRLLDGAFLGVPPLGIPLRLGTGFNNLLLNGLLLWDPKHQHVMYLPANPLEAWRLDVRGAVAGVERPGDADFDNLVTQPAHSVRGSEWFAFDWARGAARLPGGDFVLQVIKGHGRGIARTAGAMSAYLKILDSNFAPLGLAPLNQNIGFLSGCDLRGNLYFVRPDAFEGCSIIKIRVVPA